jgi:heavy metal translocating P-type ATPase
MSSLVNHQQQRTCDYCGLPLPGGALKRAAGAEDAIASESIAIEKEYCCIGCSFAASITSESGDAGEERMAMTKLGLAVFFAMSVMVFSLLLWSQGESIVGETADARLASLFYSIARYLSLLFSIPVIFLLGAPVLENAVGNVLRGRLSTDLLLAVGVAASFGYSAYHVFLGEGHVYFEVACAILVAVTLGKWLEAHCKRKMTESLSALAKLLPKRVQVLNAEGGVREVELSAIAVGDCLRILAGERIAVDGLIQSGQTLVDEQVITGESEPVSKNVHDRVLAGGLCLDGEIVVRATAAGGEGAIKRIVDAVTAAARARSKPQILAESISAWFLPGVVILALLTFALHWQTSGLYTGFANALCVVLIACPCALGLATPLAIWAGIGRASREQILVREGDALFQLADVRVVALDKTGTLTTGASLTDFEVLSVNHSADEIASIARRLSESSHHLYSKAISSRFEDAAPVDLQSVRLVMGRGVEAVEPRSGERVFLGSPRFLRESGCHFSAELLESLEIAEAKGRGVCLLAIGDQVVAFLQFSERLREGALQAIATLRDRGIELVLLSGDHRRRVEAVAGRFGIAFRAELLPEEKLAALQELRKEHGKLAMVGDGVNDAPALAAADVGIAMGCGADVSRDAAAVCLLGNQLMRIPQAIELGRLTRQTVRWNLIWTFGYNVVGISLAVTGRLHPAVAAGAMIVSSLMVVIQSLRLANIELAQSSATNLSESTDDAFGVFETRVKADQLESLGV